MDTKSILNIENYKNNYSDEMENIYLSYCTLIDKYNTNILSSVQIIKHEYFKYIYLKGLESLTYIFNILLMYTKNLTLTYHHCEKSLFYYIEFIGQIGDENHSFLQLNSKDAVLFIYKKTIFDINESFKKNFEIDEEGKKIIDNVNNFTKLYKMYSNLHVNLNSFLELDKRNEFYKQLFEYINYYFLLLVKKNIKISDLNSYIHIIKILINKKYDLDFETSKCILTILTKQINKKNNKFEQIIEKINSSKFDDNYSNLNFVKNYLTH